MKEEDIRLLEAVVRTLAGVTVSGEENLDRMLASIRALNALITAAGEPAAESNKKG